MEIPAFRHDPKEGMKRQKSERETKEGTPPGWSKADLKTKKFFFRLRGFGFNQNFPAVSVVPVWGLALRFPWLCDLFFVSAHTQTPQRIKAAPRCVKTQLNAVGRSCVLWFNVAKL